MKRAFIIIVGLETFLLVLPTRGLGPHVEFWLAATLTVITGALWVWLQLTPDD